MSTVAVLGAGNMGTALAQVAAGNGHRVHLWSIEEDVLEDIRDHQANGKYLAGVDLHPSIEPCWQLAEALDGAAIAIFSVPSTVLRSLARDAAPHLAAGTVALNVAKGLEEIEPGRAKRMSEVLAEELGKGHSAVAGMGGPAIANELARGVPTAVIVASRDAGAAATAQSVLQNEHLKVETSSDLVGVELGATLKNVYAIALGMCDGLGMGTNTKSFIVTLALEEMAALIAAMGGQPRTAYGLAGLGDLLTTGFSPHSRNRTLGEKLCTDPAWPEFSHRTTVEGVGACRIGRQLAYAHDMGAPLLEMVYDVLFEVQPPADTMRAFLQAFAYE